MRRMVRMNGLLAALVVCLLPGCQSGPGRGAQSTQPPGAPGSDHVVYRPSYAIPGTRPLYLKGYAGAGYAPKANALQAVDPTLSYERPPRRLGWWLGRNTTSR